MIFPYQQYIAGNVCSLAFWRCTKFRDRSWGLPEICKKCNSIFDLLLHKQQA